MSELSRTVIANRQEQAFEFWKKTFLKLIAQSKDIPRKQDALAELHDFFEYPGIRDNMVQAFSNFLFEIDDKLDASRKAGIQQVRDSFEQALASANPGPGEGVAAMTEKAIFALIDEQLKLENTPEETIPDVATTDLSEVGGGDEDDTPLV